MNNTQFLGFIDKVYVLHVKSGYKERANSIEKQASKYGFDFEYMLDYDIPDLTQEDIDTYIHHENNLTDAHKSLNLKLYPTEL